jgi:hypothetical protein
MAFGDVVQVLTGLVADAIALPNVQAGNTILLFTRFRSWEGGEPTSVTDDVNAGTYTKVFDEGIYGQTDRQGSCYMFANVLAGSTTVAMVGSLPFRWGMVEVEGTLVDSGVGTGSFEATAQTIVTNAAGTTLANSVSFGGMTGNPLTPTQTEWVQIATRNELQVFRRFDTASTSVSLSGTTPTANPYALGWASFTQASTGPDYTQRKGSTFDATHTLGTITTATLNGAAITINTTGAGTVNLTDTSGVTTSGVYNLVLGDGAATETYTVQLNVFGVVPSNNPAQKDGVALASLTNVQVRITSGTGLNGVQRFYSPTEATDASGNFSTLDLSSSVAADADPVLMHVLTAAGDSIISSETVGLI